MTTLASTQINRPDGLLKVEIVEHDPSAEWLDVRTWIGGLYMEDSYPRDTAWVEYLRTVNDFIKV